MRVFVTGASGFIGSAVVQELLQAGHQVLGLARSDAGAAAVRAAGAEVHRGDVEDLDSLRSGAAQSDGVLHLAFNHDFSKFQTHCENDRRAIEALGATLAGSDRLLVVTSGTLLLPHGRVVDESDVSSADFPRIASEQAVRAAAGRGTRTAVLRLAPTVHGDGDRGFVPMLIALAREKGVSAYIGDGGNHWPAVHRLDAAQLYRLAIEKGSADACYHGAAEQGVPFREIAEVIGRRLNLPVVSQTPEEAAEHFGWFAHFVAADNQASSQLTRQQLGWQPKHAGLIADLDHPRYFTD